MGLGGPVSYTHWRRTSMQAGTEVQKKKVAFGQKKKGSRVGQAQKGRAKKTRACRSRSRRTDQIYGLMKKSHIHTKLSLPRRDQNVYRSSAIRFTHSTVGNTCMSTAFSSVVLMHHSKNNIGTPLIILFQLKDRVKRIKKGQTHGLTGMRSYTTHCYLLFGLRWSGGLAWLHVPSGTACFVNIRSKGQLCLYKKMVMNAATSLD